MYRTLVLVGLLAVMGVAFAGDCLAKGSSSRSAFGSMKMPTRSSGGGLLARMNKSAVPTMPGLPTASPLGLISPRMSNAVTIFQKGGVSSQTGRLAAIGVLAPHQPGGRAYQHPAEDAHGDVDLWPHDPLPTGDRCGRDDSRSDGHDRRPALTGCGQSPRCPVRDIGRCECLLPAGSRHSSGRRAFHRS